MKASEFVKNHGVAEAKRVLHDARGCVGIKLWGKYEFSTDDLKRLVENHELVELYGGLEKAKIRCYPAKHITMESYHNLKQAIADVESCQ